MVNGIYSNLGILNIPKDLTNSNKSSSATLASSLFFDNGYRNSFANAINTAMNTAVSNFKSFFTTSLQGINSLSSGISSNTSSMYKSSMIADNNTDIKAKTNFGIEAQTFNVNINSKASKQTNNSLFFDPNEIVNSTDKQLTFTGKDNTTFNIEIDDNTTYKDLFTRVQDEVNSTEGYNADIVTNENGEVSLKVTSQYSGKDNGFEFTGKLTDVTGISKVDEQASDLELVVNDTTYTSDNNKVDILNGAITLDVEDSKQTTAQLEVKDDLSQVADNMEALVNDINKFLEEGSSYNSDGLKLIDMQMRNIISESQDELKKYGISVTEKNTLEFNREELLKAPTSAEELVKATSRYDSFFNRVERKSNEALEIPISNILPNENANDESTKTPVLYNYLNTSQKVALNNYLGAGAIIDFFF